MRRLLFLLGAIGAVFSAAEPRIVAEPHIVASPPAWGVLCPKEKSQPITLTMSPAPKTAVVVCFTPSIEGRITVTGGDSSIDSDCQGGYAFTFSAEQLVRQISITFGHIENPHQ